MSWPIARALTPPVHRAAAQLIHRLLVRGAVRACVLELQTSFDGLVCCTHNAVQRGCACSGFYAHRCTGWHQPMCGTEALVRQTRQWRTASCRPACAVEARLCCANRTLLHTSNRKLITSSPASNTAMISQNPASITNVLDTPSKALDYAQHVVPHLSPVSAHALSGGYCNYVFRIRCDVTPATASTPPTPASVILKSYPPYVATNPSLPFSQDR